MVASITGASGLFSAADWRIGTHSIDLGGKLQQWAFANLSRRVIYEYDKILSGLDNFQENFRFICEDCQNPSLKSGLETISLSALRGPRSTVCPTDTPSTASRTPSTAVPGNGRLSR